MALLLLLGAAFAVLALQLGQLATDRSGTLDFANFYVAGEIVRQGQSAHLYDIKLQREIERRISPGGPAIPYAHPPFHALPFALLAGLSYPHAFIVWGGLNLLVFALILYLLPRTGSRLQGNGFLVWLAVCTPLVAGVLLLGQDTLFFAIIFILAFLALKKKRDHLAGFVLGLGLFRFEIMLPFAFVFLLRRRWKVLAGFAMASLVAFLASLALVGWQGLLDYAHLLMEVGRATGNEANGVTVATMPTLRGAASTFFSGLIPAHFMFPLVLLATLALLGWAAWEFKSVAKPEAPAFDLEFSLAVIAALLASYHMFVHELTPLFLIGFLMLGHEAALPRESALGNRRGAALLLIFAVVYGVGGAVFHFRAFSVVAIILLGMMVWLSQEISRMPTAQRITQ
ncbi:MAG: DUF2029 domain-containing protein [Acidobacteriota bacterium]|nr:DUF2029 domain-containing protein [Acidobacteriota bacterium]